MTPSREVRDAVGEAPARERKSLEQRAAELRRIVEAPSEKERAAAELREVEARLAAEREEAVREEAEKRIVGISKAAGSLVDQLNEDVARLVAASKAYVAAVEILAARPERIEQYRKESDGVVDRFGVEGAKIPPVVWPGRNPVVIEAHRAVMAVGFPERPRGSMDATPVEQCEYGMRQRRTYAEIAGTPGYDIITQAGLKPFPELTEAQRKTLAARERDREQARKASAGLPELPTDTSLSVGTL